MSMSVNSNTQLNVFMLSLQQSTQQVNNTFNQLNSLLNGQAPAGAQTVGGAAPTTQAGGTQQADGFGQSRSLMDIYYSVVGRGQQCQPSTPNPGDASQPSGSLKVDDKGVITTPGGYKIEATGQHEWKVTGPDGKHTRVWGDPHVDEGDGGKWDFKRDSTFVLGDGTRINCSTKPWGDGSMTVTGGLEIISGNDRVQVTDIDKGKGKVGQVTQDGYAHANSFGNKDVFVMGKETDDWSFTGKEVIGSNNGGESFKLGNALAAGNTPVQGQPAGGTQPTTQKPSDYFTKMGDIFKTLGKMFETMGKLSKMLEKLKGIGGAPSQAPGTGSPANRRQDFLKTAFDAMGKMMDAYSSLMKLQQSAIQNRYTVA
jgi:hypothetical protein